MVMDEWRRVGTRNGGRRDQPLLIASHSRIIYTEALTVRDLTQGSLHTWNSCPRMSVPSSKSLPETACPSSQMALCLSGFHRYLPWGFSHFPLIIFSLGLQELFSNALWGGRRGIYIFSLPSPTFYDFEVLFYMFMFMLLLFNIVISYTSTKSWKKKNSYQIFIFSYLEVSKRLLTWLFSKQIRTLIFF